MDGLHPQVQALLQSAAGEGDPPDLAADRAGYLQTAVELGGAIEPVAAVDDVVIPRADGGRVPARVYRPQVATGDGAILYFHGGGWYVGDIETHDRVTRALANAAGHAVVSVDYRLAPECPYPAAVQDADGAAAWIRDAGARQLDVDPARVALGGDSAGGTLAALAAQHARGDGLPPVRAQLLVYPATDAAMDTPSYREFADGPMVTAADMERCWSGWLGEDGHADAASPLRATDLAGLPPTAIAVAGMDPLRDDGLRYAEALRAAGVPVEVAVYDDMAHGFIRWGGVVDRAGELLGWLGERARAALG
ncbi:MAG: alpha/beta hydrolase [Solirubrobacterales bacterium]|nr:alpha/beta hydrolase [Solirubrobacterales bacterium]